MNAKPKIYSKWRRDLLLDFINTYLREFERIELSHQEFTDGIAKELLDVIATIENNHGYTWKFIHFEKEMYDRLERQHKMDNLITMLENKREEANLQ